MSAAEALKAARAAGIRLGIDGNALTLEAATAPPGPVLDLLARHKAGIVALLRPAADDGSSGEDWRALYDERAAIAEFDGGLPRAEAEAAAFARCVEVWVLQHLRSADGRRCARCGGAATGEAVVIPARHGRGADAPRFHAACWAALRAELGEAAVTALREAGLPANSTHPE